MLRSAVFNPILLLVAEACASNPEGEAYLAENAKRKGVVVTRSGLQYRVLVASTTPGAVSPSSSTPCSVHYRGRLIDGYQFDSSYKRYEPATFAPNQVVKGCEWSHKP